MAMIGNDLKIEDFHRRADGTWVFEITYTAHFDPTERFRFFHDSVKVWEHDGVDDDQISAYAPVESFQADMVPNPVFRKKLFTITDDALHTELGHEQIYAWIWLRAAGSTGAADDERKTPFRLVDD